LAAQPGDSAAIWRRCAAFLEGPEAGSFFGMKTLFGLVMLALAPLNGLVGGVLWLTAESQTANDATVALIYLCAGLLLALGGAVLLLEARRSSEL
jgi:hypothetical protein